MLAENDYTECINGTGYPYGNESGINTTDGVTSWCNYNVNVILPFSQQIPYDRHQNIYNTNIVFGFSTNTNLVNLKGHLYNRNVSERISVYSKGINNFPTTTTTTSTTTTSTTIPTTSSTSTTTAVSQSGSWDGWIFMIVLIIAAIVCTGVVFYFKKIRVKENSNGNKEYDMLESRKWK
jgi:hypothetical protein